MEKRILFAILLVALIASTLSSCAVGSKSTSKQPHKGSTSCSHQKGKYMTNQFDYGYKSH